MKRITEAWLETNNACDGGVLYFRTLGTMDAHEIMLKLLEHNLDWANWTIAHLLNRNQRIMYAIYAAEQVLEIFETKYPSDARPRQAIEAAKAALKHNSIRTKNASDAYASAAYASADAAYYAAYYAASAEGASAAASSAAAAASAEGAYYAAYAAAAAAVGADAAMKRQIITYGMGLIWQGGA